MLNIFLIEISQTDKIIKRWRKYLLWGFILMLIGFIKPFGFRFGALIGFSVFGLGIYCVRMRGWFYDRGLWMLALFLTVILGMCYGFFFYEHILNMFILFLVPVPLMPPRADPLVQEIFSAIEIVFFFHFSWKQIRLSYSVFHYNWKFSHLLSILDKKRQSHSLQ
jgi:hypothetical protein